MDVSSHEVTSCLKTYFGYTSFRQGQSLIISSILSCKDTIGIMPTGQGKSICYQVPAAVMRGTAIVITPLIALMKDQEDYLKKANYPVASINSFLSPSQIESILFRVRQGKIKLLYVSPERLGIDSFIMGIKGVHISFVAVDEAHCISEWGHEFRPTYKSIKKNLEKIMSPRPPILALTATATQSVILDIKESLDLQNPYEYIGGLSRENLVLSVFKLSEKYSKINQILDRVEGASIIYANSRKETEEIAEFLRGKGISSLPYHAGMEENLRKENQEKFFNGSCRVMCATSAFGMGINKADIRTVIHFNPPLSLEQYYQEAGRAGRDGFKSYAVLIYNEKDIENLKNKIAFSYPPKKLAEKLITLLDKETKVSTHFLRESMLEKLKEKMDNLSASEINTMLVSLARYEFIEYEAFLLGQIHFKVSQEEMVSYAVSPAEREVMDACIRELGSQPFVRKVKFDLAYISKKRMLDKQATFQILKKWQRQNILDFQTDEEVRINVLKQREQRDFSVLEKKRQIALRKLDAMIEFVSTSNCRMSAILKYFSDPAYEEPCGKCDNCISLKKRALS